MYRLQNPRRNQGTPDPRLTPVYVGRFAPSPTGPLHYGSLVAAVASYLDARHNHGIWLLRIEDLDPPRESSEAPAEIMRQLEAYGLNWDGEVLYQSTRLSAYRETLSSLEDRSFCCNCSRKSTPPVYPGTCREKQLTGDTDLQCTGASSARTQSLGLTAQSRLLLRQVLPSL